MSLFPWNITLTREVVQRLSDDGPVTLPAFPCVSLSPSANVSLAPVKYTFSPTAYPPGSGGGGERLSTVR